MAVPRAGLGYRPGVVLPRNSAVVAQEADAGTEIIRPAAGAHCTLAQSRGCWIIYSPWLHPFNDATRYTIRLISESGSSGSSGKENFDVPGETESEIKVVSYKFLLLLHDKNGHKYSSCELKN